jgi:matrixin
MRWAAVLLILLVPLPALAYKRSVNSEGKFLFWATRGHSFQIHAQGTADVPGTSEFDAIRRSFATWAAVTCSDLTFPEVLPPEQGDRRIGYFTGETNRNLVLWRTESCATAAPSGDPCHTQGGCSNKYDCWEHGSTAIAVTTTTSISSTGEILDSDIELNDANHFFTVVDAPPCGSRPPAPDCVSIDVQNTMTHEAGHTIGLDHTDDPSATMAAFAPEGETSKRTLNPDDVQGVCDIYPKGGPTSTSPGVPAVIPPDLGGGCESSSRASSWEALLLPLSLLALRCRRRHATI